MHIHAERENSPLLISLSLILLCPEMLFFCAVQSAVSCVIFFPCFCGSISGYRGLKWNPCAMCWDCGCCAELVDCEGRGNPV